MIVEVPHPERGTFKTVGCPLKLSGSPVEVTASPLLSEHTDDILADVMGLYARKDCPTAPGRRGVRQSLDSRVSAQR